MLAVSLRAVPREAVLRRIAQDVQFHGGRAGAHDDADLVARLPAKAQVLTPKSQVPQEAVDLEAAT